MKTATQKICLAEEDVRETLIDKRIVRVASRSRRDKDAEDSESDYFPNEVIASQATSHVFLVYWYELCRRIPRIQNFFSKN
jgi:hypothetical protein